MQPLREALILYPYIIATSFGVFTNGQTRFGVPTPPTEPRLGLHAGLQHRLRPRAARSYTTTNAFPYDQTCTLPVTANQLVRGAVRRRPRPAGWATIRPSPRTSALPERNPQVAEA